MDEDILSEISFPPPLSPLDDISCKIFNTDKIVRESNHNDPPVNLANYNIADIFSELELPPLLSPLADCFEPFEDVECILKDEIDDKQFFDDIENQFSDIFKDYGLDVKSVTSNLAWRLYEKSQRSETWTIFHIDLELWMFSNSNLVNKFKTF